MQVDPANYGSHVYPTHHKYGTKTRFQLVFQAHISVGLHASDERTLKTVPTFMICTMTFPLPAELGARALALVSPNLAPRPVTSLQPGNSSDNRR